jgi:hypothetical protein
VAVVSHYVPCVGEESGTWCSDSGYSSESLPVTSQET